MRRSLSPFSCEPLYTPPEEILCNGSEDEDSPEVRHQTRKRREAIGRRLLQGSPPFMLSASLRGPLDDGWVNPWSANARSLGATDMGGTAEVPPKPLKRSADDIFGSDRIEKQHERATSRAANAPIHVLPSSTHLPEFEYRHAARETTSSSSTSSSRPTLSDRMETARKACEEELKNFNSKTRKERLASMTPFKFDEAAVRARLNAGSELIRAEADLRRAKEDLDILSSSSSSQSTLREKLTAVTNRSKANLRLARATAKLDSLRSSASSSQRLINEKRKAADKESPGEARARRCRELLDHPVFKYSRQNSAKLPSSASLSSSSPDQPPSDKGLEPTNREAPARTVKRLSFTASGNVKKFGSLGSPYERAPSPTPLQTYPVEGNGVNQDCFSSKDNPMETFTKHTNEASRGSDAQPEAQIVSGGPGMTGIGPSGPSTNLLETDKFSLDEGDSYADLSTQAAIFKAQQSFTRDFIPPPNDFMPDRFRERESDLREVTPEAKKRRTMAGFPVWPPGAGVFSLNEQDPMSTQAMVDALSPFAITTAKKERYTDMYYPKPSKYEGEARTSPSMSRSPSPPDSPTFQVPVMPLLSSAHSLHSFSIEPNGTLTTAKKEKHTDAYYPKPSKYEGEARTSPSMSRSPSPPAHSLHTFSIAPNGTLTTAKKEKQTDAYYPKPSKYDGEARTSPSMSRSPSPPTSPTFQAPFMQPSSALSLPSFSIAPNGTLTEVYQHDGQRPVPIYPILEDWDLEAAIEEAGTFLGSWDVETEARKEGEAAQERSRTLPMLDCGTSKGRKRKGYWS